MECSRGPGRSDPKGQGPWRHSGRLRRPGFRGAGLLDRGRQLPSRKRIRAPQGQGLLQGPGQHSGPQGRQAGDGRRAPGAPLLLYSAAPTRAPDPGPRTPDPRPPRPGARVAPFTSAAAIHAEIRLGRAVETRGVPLGPSPAEPAPAAEDCRGGAGGGRRRRETVAGPVAKRRFQGGGIVTSRRRARAPAAPPPGVPGRGERPRRVERPRAGKCPTASLVWGPCRASVQRVIGRAASWPAPSRRHLAGLVPAEERAEEVASSIRDPGAPGKVQRQCWFRLGFHLTSSKGLLFKEPVSMWMSENRGDGKTSACFHRDSQPQ